MIIDYALRLRFTFFTGALLHHVEEEEKKEEKEK